MKSSSHRYRLFCVTLVALFLSGCTPTQTGKPIQGEQPQATAPVLQPQQPSQPTAAVVTPVQPAEQPRVRQLIKLVEQAYAFPIYILLYTIATTDTVHDLTIDTHGFPEFHGAWLSA